MAEFKTSKDSIKNQTTADFIILPQITTTERNSLVGVENGAKIYNITTQSENTYVDGNWIDFNNYSTITSLGRIIYVSKNGNDTTGIIGRVDKPFLTIQSAFNASSSGDTIYIFHGTYNENLNLTDKNINFYFYGNHIGSIILGSTSNTNTYNFYGDGSVGDITSLSQVILTINNLSNINSFTSSSTNDVYLTLNNTKVSSSILMISNLFIISRNSILYNISTDFINNGYLSLSLNNCRIFGSINFGRGGQLIATNTYFENLFSNNISIYNRNFNYNLKFLNCFCITNNSFINATDTGSIVISILKSYLRTGTNALDINTTLPIDIRLYLDIIRNGSITNTGGTLINNIIVDNVQSQSYLDSIISSEFFI